MPGLCLTSEQVQRLCVWNARFANWCSTHGRCEVPVPEGERCLRTVVRRSGFSATASQGGPETKQLGGARDEASCVVKSLGRSEGASVVVRIIVEPCGDLHNEIGVPRKEWRHVHDG